ncbi:MAG: molybdopterin-dependent oxidoreductase [Chloroflexota bacterium]|nr:molybdopterin-dependent oxidoreductase [Chloroflexota bacterium]
MVERPEPASLKPYRERWSWDAVYWGSHCVDCYPGSCPYRVYVKDGKIAYEEAAGTVAAVVEGIPDRNPMGCQKGAAWSETLTGAERVLYPMRRDGPRGAGRWKRISWDAALTEIADGVIDAIQEGGPETIVHEMTPAEGGFMAIWPVRRLLCELLGGISTDVNAVINDFQPGHYITWGKFNPVSTPESRWYAELRLIWHSNPAYTQIPNYHLGCEARYQGTEVIHFAPDTSPSHVHADYYFPVRAGTDAALALAMCKVIIDEGIYDRKFVQRQTDLPLLVRLDTHRFLRQSDIEEGGSEEQFYWYDARAGEVVEAPRTTLRPGRRDPALEGRYSARLKDGTRVRVAPVFALLRAHLAQYTPEKAQQITDVHPDVIRRIARKVATRRTTIGMGMNLCKYYHGDLVQRSMILLLALTGNWGRHGSGIGSWSPGNFEGPGIFGAKTRPGPEETRRVLRQREAALPLMRAMYPDMTDEMAHIEGMVNAMRAGLGGIVPPAWMWYYHAGFRERWNVGEWNDPSMKRTFDAYVQEALDKGWWQGTTLPAADRPPRVLFEVGGNLLRRQRGGRTHALKHEWPNLKLIVSVDWRMSTTGMHSDIILPAAQHYEKPNFHLASPSLLQLTYSDTAVEPAGEAKSEWEIFKLLAGKIERRARRRKVVSYSDHAGRERSFKDLVYRYSLGLDTVDEVIEEWVRDTAIAGNIAKGESLKTMKKRGYAMFTDIGQSVSMLNQASDIEPGKPFTSLTWHTDKLLPYPTLTRRAQFYIDHDWFLEAGEELPVHKENPAMGGEHPFVLTSGHNRWSIHSMNITNKLMLQTHRGAPHMVMNTGEALRRGIADNEAVRVFNDCGSFEVPVKLSESVRPGQVIVYNGWDPYQFKGWTGPMDVEPGMVKWLHFAGGYGHLRYWPIQWQPVQVDRAVRVDIEKLPASALG